MKIPSQDSVPCRFVSPFCLLIYKAAWLLFLSDLLKRFFLLVRCGFHGSSFWRKREVAKARAQEAVSWRRSSVAINMILSNKIPKGRAKRKSKY